MPSQRVLAGISHDIAHHAGSSVSWLHPHLHDACMVAGVREATIDLIEPVSYPDGLPLVRPLYFALAALREKFLSLLTAHGLDPADLHSAHLRVQFPLLGADGYACRIRSCLVSSRGRTFTACIDQ
jgi:hypothetical protein